MTIKPWFEDKQDKYRGRRKTISITIPRSYKMKKTKNKTPKYIFPDFLAKAMSKVDMRTQYEASMLSMSLMSLGLIATIAYLIIYFDLQWWYKIFLAINGLAGMTFMWSFLTTTYQQYRTYMIAVNFQKELKGGKKDGVKKEKKD